MSVTNLIQLLLVVSMISISSISFFIFRHYKLVHKRFLLYFIAYTFFAFLWSLGCYLTLFANSESWVTLGLTLFYIPPMMVLYLMLMFSKHYEDREIKSKLVSIGQFVLFTYMIGLISWFVLGSPEDYFYIKSIPQYGMNEIVLEDVRQYSIYSYYFTASSILTYYVLYRQYRKIPLEEEGNKFKLLAAAMVISSSIGAATNLILPQVTGSMSTIWIGASVSTLAFGSISFYSIVWGKLFEFKTSVFRAVGYSLSIATLVLIYSIVIYGILLPLIYPGTTLEISSLVLLSIGTATTVFFFDKIKTVFDAITDRLFFKNSYNLPKFLDDFNQALINSSDVGELADSIFRVMGDTLKTEFFLLVIKHDKFEITIDSRRKESIREVDAKAPLSLMNYHFKSGDRVVLSDYLNKEKFEGLYEILKKEDASAAIDLSESSKTTGSLKKALESGNFKAMLLGPKRSGESYNAQDLDALRIISKELVVGLQNAMRFEEIKLFNLELQHKVDLATGKLREQNKKLVVADELKDDFLSIASHQMRTPISAINGYASILNSGDAGKLNKNQQKFAKIIEDSTKRLSYLINDFLTVSRLKSGKFSIEKTDTDLNKVLKSEVSNLTTQFKAKNVKLKVSIDENLPIIKADESKIRQVMMNLIDNALYYTPTEGEVNVSLKKTTGGITFEVKDSGIGVPKDDQSKLFSKMFRAGNAQKMRPDGTGLGLYLAKKVILGHHGHIIFNSVENEGSTFGFRIPTK